MATLQISCPGVKWKNLALYAGMVDSIIRDSIPYPLTTGHEAGDYFPITYQFETELDALNAKDALDELDLSEIQSVLLK